MGDFNSAITNLRLGNKAPTQAKMAQFGNLCDYCKQRGHWKSNCPKLHRDFGLPAPNPGCPENVYVPAVGGNNHIDSLVQSTSATTLDDSNHSVNATATATPGHIALDSGGTITGNTQFDKWDQYYPA